MLILDKEMAFISNYLAEKEYFMNDDLRKALSYIYYLIHKKHKSKSLAIYIANEKYKKIINRNTQEYYNFTTEYLWKMYNSRLAHIKNAKEKFKIWDLNIRLKHYGMEKKLCECGCGQEVKKSNQRFIHGHNVRTRSKKEKQFYAKLMLEKRNRKENIIKVDFKSLKKSM